MLDRSRFSLNRILAPRLGLDDFFKLTNSLGLDKVELRNDLPGGRITDGYSPKEAKTMADSYGIGILTINAVQKFNLGPLLDGVVAEVTEMLRTASALGCTALVLCPNNDVLDKRSPARLYSDTVAALRRIAPLFESSGVLGLVEPLGFEECSLRSKETAVRAIAESGYDRFMLVHDTFHHYLGPDEGLSASHTGLVHVSGVEAKIQKGKMRDEHRILIGAKDVMGNKAQIDDLERQGYTGPYSFEPFSADVQGMPLESLKAAIEESLEYIATRG